MQHWIQDFLTFWAWTWVIAIVVQGMYWIVVGRDR